MPLGHARENKEILDMVTGRSRFNAVARLDRLVVEEDGVVQDRNYRDLLDSLELIVPEVVVCNVYQHGCRWANVEFRSE